jgi:hypothetical protein
MSKKDNTIDFDKMDWGSLTNQFKRSKIPNIADLKEFSKYIEKHPEKFHTKTLKRARFYNNVISKKGKGLSTKQQINDYGSMLTHLTSHIIDPKELIDPRDYKQSKYLIDEIKKIKGKGIFWSRPRQVAPDPNFVDLTTLDDWELQQHLENTIARRTQYIQDFNAAFPFGDGGNVEDSPGYIEIENLLISIRAEIARRNPETKEEPTTGGALNPLVPFHTIEYGKVVGSHSAPPVRRYSRPYRKKKYPPNYMNPWIAFVKAFASKHSLKYSDAIKDPRCKAEYAKKKSGSGMESESDEEEGMGMESAGMPSKTHRGEKDYTTKKGDKDYHQQHHLVAGTPYTKKMGKGMVDNFISQAYNASQLGANGGRKFISL